jgi:hypothetical protein
MSHVALCIDNRHIDIEQYEDTHIDRKQYEDTYIYRCGSPHPVYGHTHIDIE